MLVRIANRDDPDQTASSEAVMKQSDLGLLCLSRPFKQTTCVLKFRTLCMVNVLKFPAQVTCNTVQTQIRQLNQQYDQGLHC